MAGSVMIVGLGAVPRLEATVESLQALGSCPTVFADFADRGMADWLARYCQALRKPEGEAAVLQAARAGERVGLAVWGHPEYSSRLARKVFRQCRKENIPCEVLGAVSPIASALARSLTFLGGIREGRRFGHLGMQAYDLETALADPSSIVTRLPLVVYAEDAAAPRWRELARRLASRYPGSHPVRVFGLGGEAERTLPLKGLAAAGLGAGLVLVLPLKSP